MKTNELLNKGIVWLIFLALLQFSAIESVAQVGINSPTPHASAILDVAADDRGILIPRLSSNQWKTLYENRNPANGLTIFAKDYKMFTFYESTNNAWFSLNPWVLKIPTGTGSLITNASNNLASSDVYLAPSIGGNVGIGVDAPEEKLHVNGNVKATRYKLADGSDLLPVGTIVMWSGAINSIPSGWKLCDGTGTAPDLRDRFIVGAGSTYNSGNTGGANRVTIAISEIPSHNHDKGTLNITNSGDHSHTTNAPKKGSKQVGQNSGNGEPAQSHAADDGTISGLGNHTHGNKNFAGETGYAGGLGRGHTAAHENRPPYYALAFIIKLPY